MLKDKYSGVGQTKITHDPTNLAHLPIPQRLENLYSSIQYT